MRLLLVGFVSSVHMARYVSQLDGLGWDLHVFDSLGRGALHPDLRGVTLHVPDRLSVQGSDESLRLVRFPTGDGDWAGSHARALARLIRALKPDVLHTHEVQHGGYIALRARALIPEPFPPWLVTNWGSDIDLFGHEPAHAAHIAQVMKECDYYCSECHRDVAHARRFGFRGKVIGVWPVAGGFDLERCRKLWAPGAPSARRVIALKARTGRFARGIVGIEALELCSRLLSGYELCIYEPANDEIVARCRRLCHEAGMELSILPRTAFGSATHDEMLSMHGRARASINLQISDGLSTSFLEAAVMGSLPVQSDTGCQDELIRGGIGALYVPPDSAKAVAGALRRALLEPELVNDAAAANTRMARAHLDHRMVRSRVIDAYERISEEALVTAGAA